MPQWRGSLQNAVRRVAGAAHGLAGQISSREPLTSPATFALCANGRRIYVDPADDRGKTLVRRAGDLNPLSLILWRIILDERIWSIVIDVGANYGEMLTGVDLPQSVTAIALEPNPFIVPYLRRTLEEAAIKVELIAKAASARSGTATLSIDRDWSGFSSIAGIGPEAVNHAIELVEVPAVTLAALVKERAQGQSVRLLVKIDVENHEVAVLQGLDDMLEEFEEFAAMVEILHLGDADLEWVLARFSIELLDTETRTLSKIDATTAAELQNVRAGGKFYVQDAVLRRRTRAATKRELKRHHR